MIVATNGLQIYQLTGPKVRSCSSKPVCALTCRVGEDVCERGQVVAQRQAAQPVKDLHGPVRVSTLGQLLQAGKQGWPCVKMSRSEE